MHTKGLSGDSPEFSKQNATSPFSSKQPSGLLTPPEAAERLGIQSTTLSVWRSTGRYSIPFIKIGSRVRYRQADLDAWLEERTRNSGATE